MIGTSISRRHENFAEVVRSYYQLTKPRIIPVLLITTASSMWIASNGQVDPLLLLVTLTVVVHWLRRQPKQLTAFTIAILIMRYGTYPQSSFAIW